MYIELRTERLLLRPVAADDAEATFIYSSDSNLTRYMIFFPKDSVEEVRQFLQESEAEWQKDSPNFFEFAVMRDGVQIGGVSLWLNENHTEGELGWLLRREYHGKGYALESARALCDFAFDTLGLSRLIAQCDARNTPSAKLMDKLGMTLIDDTGMRTYLKRDEIAHERTYALLNTNQT